MQHPPTDRLAEVRTLSEQLPRFMRVIHALKSQAARADSRDRAALVLLFPLVRLGPLRQGALADLARATAGWDTADLATLTTLFGRLVDDLAVTLPGSPDGGTATDLHPARE